MKEYYEVMQLIDELDDKYETDGKLRELVEKEGMELSDAEFYLKSMDIIASCAVNMRLKDNEHE